MDLETFTSLIDWYYVLLHRRCPKRIRAILLPVSYRCMPHIISKPDGNAIMKYKEFELSNIAVSSVAYYIPPKSPPTSY